MVLIIAVYLIVELENVSFVAIFWPFLQSLFVWFFSIFWEVLSESNKNSYYSLGFMEIV